jgi:hypothetical protein
VCKARSNPPTTLRVRGQAKKQNAPCSKDYLEMLVPKLFVTLRRSLWHHFQAYSLCFRAIGWPRKRRENFMPKRPVKVGTRAKKAAPCCLSLSSDARTKAIRNPKTFTLASF